MGAALRGAGAVRLARLPAGVAALALRFSQLLSRRPAVPRRRSAGSALRLGMVATAEGSSRARSAVGRLRAAHDVLGAAGRAADVAVRPRGQARLAGLQPAVAPGHRLVAARDHRAAVPPDRADWPPGGRAAADQLPVRAAAPVRAFPADRGDLVLFPRVRRERRRGAGRRGRGEAVPGRVRPAPRAQETLARAGEHGGRRTADRGGGDRAVRGRALERLRAGDRSAGRAARRGHRSLRHAHELAGGDAAPVAHLRTGAEPAPARARARRLSRCCSRCSPRGFSRRACGC